MVRQAREARQARQLPHLYKFSEMLTLSQPEGADHASKLALPHLKISVITPLYIHILLKFRFSEKGHIVPFKKNIMKANSA